MSKPLRELTSQHPHVGTVQCILLRSGRDQAMQNVDQVEAVPGRGLIGDRYSDRERDLAAPRKREISLIQAEHLPLIASWMNLPTIDPTLLRRNLVIEGINLIAMRSPFKDGNSRWRIGDDVIIEITGPCDPCSKMETALGVGGYNAMRGHGGMTARLIAGGIIRVGDSVRIANV